MSTATEAVVGRREGASALVPSPLLGMVLFVLTEAMFFAGLVSAYLVLRAGQLDPWPPPGQPRLPVGLTALNTLALLASGALVAVARRRQGAPGTVAALATGSLLGWVFLLVQGREWLRLVGYGLTMTSSLYGATFYTLIGAHALHVLGGSVGLVVTLARARGGAYAPGRDVGLRLCELYWLFVVGLWPVLYVLVYLV